MGAQPGAEEGRDERLPRIAFNLTSLMKTDGASVIDAVLNVWYSRRAWLRRISRALDRTVTPDAQLVWSSARRQLNALAELHRPHRVGNLNR